MEPNKDVFQYTYSAKQQEEIEAIRKKYLPPQEDKMEQLRRLDKSTTKKGTSLSIVVGVAGCLLMGVGHVLLHGVDGEPVYPRYHPGAAGHRLGGGGPPRVPACHQKRAGKAGPPHPPADRGTFQAGVRKRERKTLDSAFASRRKL